jgi:hypothetical protein
VEILYTDLSMSKAFAGDSFHMLPAQKVEPYRLWFEFLKLAFQDPNIKVNRRLYQAWGVIENVEFKSWWSDNWRKLFATDVGVRVFDPHEKLSANDSTLVVRLPLNKKIKDTLTDVRHLLEGRSAGRRLRNSPAGSFSLTKGFEQGFLKKLNTARCMLRLYGIWLKHDDKDRRKRVEASTLDYCEWAAAWDRKIAEMKWNRPRPFFPICFKEYAHYIRERRSGVKVRGGQAAAIGNAENARRQVVRYLAKAQRLARNVGQGSFPGSY